MTMNGNLQKLVFGSLLAAVMSCTPERSEPQQPPKEELPAHGIVNVDSICIKKIVLVSNTSCAEYLDIVSGTGYRTDMETCNNIAKYNELTGLPGYTSENIDECFSDINIASNYLIQRKDELGLNYGALDFFVTSLNIKNKKRTLCGETEFAKGLRGKEITDICGSGDGIEFDKDLMEKAQQQFYDCASCRR